MDPKTYSFKDCTLWLRGDNLPFCRVFGSPVLGPKYVLLYGHMDTEPLNRT